MPQVYDESDFTPFPVEEESTGSHLTRKGTLKDSDKEWYCKYSIANAELAHMELLAQEFFRLFIPHQPETRLAKRLAANTGVEIYSVLSEAVPGFQKLPQTPKDFGNGTITGLGQAMVCAMFLQEIDLKNGNLGRDFQNRVIKIDGDWCFAKLHGEFKNRSEVTFSITPEVIDSLPYPGDYPAFEWLDVIEKWQYKYHDPTNPFDPSCLEPALAHNEQFRSEVNQALLQIYLMPDQYIEAFTGAYISSDDKGPYIDLLKARRDELRKSAMQNESFKAYVTTTKAQKTADAFLSQMKSFAAAGVSIIAPGDHDKLSGDVGELLVQLRDEVEAEAQVLAQTLVQECNQKIGSLQSLCHLMDKPLATYISDSITRVAINKDDSKELQKITSNLNGILRIMKSEQFIEVKNQIELFRADWGAFTNAKADRVEKALYNTPLNERAQVISNPVANDVQRALAGHRNPFKDELPQNIDVEEAATSFKTLKTKYTQTKDQDDDPESDTKLKIK